MQVKSVWFGDYVEEYPLPSMECVWELGDDGTESWYPLSTDGSGWGSVEWDGIISSLARFNWGELRGIGDYLRVRCVVYCSGGLWCWRVIEIYRGTVVEGLGIVWSLLPRLEGSGLFYLPYWRSSVRLDLGGWFDYLSSCSSYLYGVGHRIRAIRVIPEGRVYVLPYRV